MPHQHIYAFEAIDDSLPFLPLAARRLLDANGRKLSLEGWLSLTIGERRAIVRAGAEEDPRPGEGKLAELLSLAVPPASTVPGVQDPSNARVPPLLTEALGTARPLDDVRWQALDALDRYALVKCSAKADRLDSAYDEIVRAPRLTHVSGSGGAKMVAVGAKPETVRRAVASARVRTTSDVVRAIDGGSVAKGDVLGAARIAAIMAAKRTAELIPLCHPVHTTSASVDFDLDSPRGELRVVAIVEALDRTGVEMEAMLAASIASLTIYDMIKSADRWAVIEDVRLEHKTGGKSGDVTRPVQDARSGDVARPVQDARSGDVARPAQDGKSDDVAHPVGGDQSS
jgi:molybdenum cofactor biosynthesis protein MoaC